MNQVTAFDRKIRVFGQSDPKKKVAAFSSARAGFTLTA
jgi:hypothetical protein